MGVFEMLWLDLAVSKETYIISAVLMFKSSAGKVTLEMNVIRYRLQITLLKM